MFFDFETNISKFEKIKLINEEIYFNLILLIPIIELLLFLCQYGFSNNRMDHCAKKIIKHWCIILQYLIIINLLYEAINDESVKKEILQIYEYMCYACALYILTMFTLIFMCHYFEDRICNILNFDNHIKKICWKLQYNTHCYVNKKMITECKIILEKVDYDYLFHYKNGFSWNFLLFNINFSLYKFLTYENMEHIKRVIFLSIKYPCLNDYLFSYVKFYDTKFNCDEHLLFAVYNTIYYSIVKIIGNEIVIPKSKEKNYYKMIDLAKKLLSIDKKIINKQFCGKTILHHAIIGSSKHETMHKLILFLVNNGAELNYLKKNHRVSMLVESIKYEAPLKTIKYLIIQDNEFTTYRNGNTILHEILRKRFFWTRVNSELLICAITILVNEHVKLPTILNNKGRSAIDQVVKNKLYHKTTFVTNLDGNIIERSKFNTSGKIIVKTLLDVGTPIENYFNGYKDNYDPEIKEYYDKVKNKVWKNRIERIQNLN